jgi:hypothetical protein
VVATALVVAGAAAFPGPAAAELPEVEGAVLESFSASPETTLSFWTKARREMAEPLPALTLPGSPPEESTSLSSPLESPAEETGTSSTGSEPTPTAARTAAVARTASAETALIGGTEIGPAESVLYPNRANGKIYGEYRIGLEKELYQCSGSVINSPHGDVVLTAGHCVIDPETGTVANKLLFVPAYRDHSEPFERWAAEAFATTEAWKKTAKAGSHANEGGDLALLVLVENGEEKSVEDVVGGLGIAFDQSCSQTYTQYGYPAEAPYDGETLYSNIAAYAGPDTNSLFSPSPIKIASDFTQGASGGPWTIGPSSSPTVLSLTDYGYEDQPGWLYGAYFGEAARKAYELASGKVVPAGIEETCKALPVPPPTPEPEPTKPVEPTPPIESTPPQTAVTVKVTRVRRRANGSAVLTAQVSSAGMLKLSGSAVRAESINAPTAGKYRMVVSPKGVVTRRLLQDGRAKVGVKVAFSASGKISRVSRAIQLNRRSAARNAQPQARHLG